MIMDCCCWEISEEPCEEGPRCVQIWTKIEIFGSVLAYVYALVGLCANVCLEYYV